VGGLSDRSEIPREIRRTLVDPVKLCRDLGLAEKSKRQAGGLSIRCPVHNEKDPSCSVTRGPDGTIRVKCFGCAFATDALGLIAVARGLNVRSGFVEVLREGCRLAGRHDLEEALSGAPVAERTAQPVRAPEPEPEAERDYPPADEVEALWAAAQPVTEDTDASGHLVGRRIDPEGVAALDLARVLLRNVATDRLPRWARHRGVWWRDSGHRMLVRVFDSDGVFRSLRGWRVREGDTPKRLPPGGHRAAGLALANEPAQAMLRGDESPGRVVVVEGEPDWVVRSVANPRECVIGILSGTWHEGFAARVPYGAEVLVRTHLDKAGDRYADDVIKSVRDRALVSRWKPQATWVAP
jgi:hypothetical protein